MKRLLSQKLWAIILVGNTLITPVLPVYAMDEMLTATQSAEATESAAFSNFSGSVLPEASDSAGLGSTAPAVTLSDIAQASQSAIPADPFATPSPVLLSGQLKRRSAVRQLPKKTYRADESVEVVVENAAIAPFSITVTNSRGIPVRLPVKVRSLGDALVFDVLPPSDLKPGAYTLTVTDETGKVTAQDYSWGVLAINPDRSRYLLGQTAQIGIAVLDDGGYVVCDAGVTLAVKSPDGSEFVLSTADGSIRVTGMCWQRQPTTTPDYETSLPIVAAGTYQLILTAQTRNGTKTITDSFSAETTLPFDIRREAPTRIYPPTAYPVILTITANQDFHGQIVETVPESFVISPQDEVLEYAGISVVSPVIPAEDIDLARPFAENFNISLGFGETVTDSLEKPLYDQFGLVGHDGVDFALPVGTPINAADGGEVLLAEDSTYGLTVIIRHSWGQTYYGHLSEIQVKTGDTVSKGSAIGLSGNTGITTGPHLHFGLKLNLNEPDNGYFGKTDPLPYLTGIAEISLQTVKTISWNVNFKAGETIKIGYRFRAPNLFPWMFLAGPLRFIAPGAGSTEQVAAEASAASGFVLGARSVKTEEIEVYSEARQWQIASDAVALAQTPVTNGGKAVTTLAATITAATANNLIVVVCSSSLAETLGVSTSGFSSAINESGAAPSQAVYYKVATGGETTVTCTYGTGTGNRAGIQVFEYSGLRTTGVLDVAVGASTGTSANPAAPAATTTNAEDLILGSVSIMGNTAFSAWTNSFTEQTDTTDGQTPASSRITFGTADFSAASISTYSTVATAGVSGSWRGQTVAFKQIATTASTDVQMRHGNWFSGGVEQGFTL